MRVGGRIAVRRLVAQVQRTMRTSPLALHLPATRIYISLGGDFPDFFANKRSEILVRHEYPKLLNYLKEVQAGRLKRTGVVLIGRPGIGREPSRIYVHFLPRNILPDRIPQTVRELSLVHQCRYLLRLPEKI
jgi:hypothetical protein